MLQLQRNVPPPAAPRKPVDGRKKYPFTTMQVNDFFFIAGKKRNTVRTYFISVGARLGITLKSQLIHARKDEDGTWRPCDADVPGAVVGVGVWRTE